MTKRIYGLASKKKARNLRWMYLPFMALLALGAASFATQRVAAFYGYHAALGRPWFSFKEVPWYAPWSVFSWSRQFPDQYGYMEQCITYAQAVFLLPQFFLLGYWLMGKKLKGTQDLHGSARWAEKEEIREMGYLSGKGVYVGGWFHQGRTAKTHYYLRHNGPEHILCFAPTRSGKGVGLILPTLLSWPGSSLTLDIKGENWALSAGYRRSLGHRVLRFDPADVTGQGCAFNPLEELRIDTLHAVQDVQNIAQMLVDPEGKGLADHWSKAAFAFFSGLILHGCVMVRKNQGRPATLTDLTHLLADEKRPVAELLTEMLDAPHAAYLEELFPGSRGGEAAHAFIASSAREMKNKEDKEASGVLSTALVNMALYRDPIVTLNTSRSDFQIRDLMNHENPVDLYLVISPADIDRVRPLTRLMLDMIVRRVCAEMKFSDGASVAGYRHRLLLMLDEFTSQGKIPVMEKAIAYIAGYGGKMYLIVQDLKQLNGAYGKDNAIMANCHVRIAYAPNDVETAKLLSDMAGKATVVENKVSFSGSRIGAMKNASMNVAETGRPLLTPDECMRLPGMRKEGKAVIPGDMLIFTAGQPPIYGRQILYFQDPVFSRRAKIPAPEQSDSLHPDSPAASPRSSQTTSVPKLNNSAQELNKEEIRARYFPA